MLGDVHGLARRKPTPALEIPDRTSREVVVYVASRSIEGLGNCVRILRQRAHQERAPLPPLGAHGVSMTDEEIARIERHIRRILGNPEIELDAPAAPCDPAEMRIGSILIGTVSKQDDEGEILYSLVIDIAPEDLGNGT